MKAYKTVHMLKFWDLYRVGITLHQYEPKQSSSNNFYSRSGSTVLYWNSINIVVAVAGAAVVVLTDNKHTNVDARVAYYVVSFKQRTHKTKYNSIWSI
jgi:hypothetical protein